MNRLVMRYPPEQFLRQFAQKSSPLSRSPLNTSSLQRNAVNATRCYRAAVCHKLDGTVTVEDKESTAELRAGEVRVRVEAAGINFGDLLMLAGDYQVKLAPPFTPGGEFAGTVTEVAADVTTLAPGARVAGGVVCGAFAEEVIGAADMMWEIPARMTFDEAAAFVTSYGTALVGLSRRARLRRGETVLVTAAAGAAGLAAVDVARNVFDARVIGAAGSDEKCALIRTRGAQHAVNYKRESVRDAVKAISPRGADVIFDAVGGKIFKDCLRSVAWEGRLLVVGFASGEIPQIPANHLLVKNVSAVGLYWGAYRERDREVLDWSVRECMRYYEQGTLRPHVGATFKLCCVNKALDFVRSRKSTGKVVIKMR